MCCFIFVVIKQCYVDSEVVATSQKPKCQIMTETCLKHKLMCLECASIPEYQMLLWEIIWITFICIMGIVLIMTVIHCSADELLAEQNVASRE